MAHKRSGGGLSTAQQAAKFLGVSVLAGAVLAGIALPAVGALGLSAKGTAAGFDDLPGELKQPPLSQASKILDANGGLIATVYSRDRTVVPISRMSPNILQAIVDIEDARYYEHGALDVKGILRALSNNASDGSTQGASTLTQQYVNSRGDHMQAVQIVSHDGPAAVKVVDLAHPEPRGDEVLIRVRAAGVSFPELLQTRGAYQVSPDLPFVPGAEIAGEVIAAPPGGGISPGDRVAAFSLQGGFAQKAVAAAERIFPLPDRLTFVQGAALPLNYLTAYFGLVERGQLKPGESVLVHGAAGGVGSAAVQIAKAFGAGPVIAVTSTAEKGAVAVAAGADEFVLAHGFRDAVRDGSAPGGVDLVFDPVGGDRFTDSLRCLKDDGRLLVVGFTAGEIPTVKVNRLLLTNVSVVGVGLGVYGFTRPGHIGACWAAITPHIESGRLDPVISATYPLAEAAAALADLDGRRAVGKVLLTM